MGILLGRLQRRRGRPTYKLTGLRSDAPVVHSSGDSRSLTALRSVYEARGRAPFDEVSMVGHLYLFLGQLIRDHGGETRQLVAHDYLARALRFVQHNFSEEIGVEDIARYAGISRSQLYRAFVGQCTMSPHEFLQRYRINKACRLLQHGGFSVTEIAGSVGFSDPLYFSRVFKKIKGMTPSGYSAKSKCTESLS